MTLVKMTLVKRAFSCMCMLQSSSKHIELLPANSHLPSQGVAHDLERVEMKQTIAGEIKPPRPGGYVFTFKETEHPDGGAPRTIIFTEVEIKPLGYEELDSSRLHQAITIPLEMCNARILECDADGVDLSKCAHITTTLVSPFAAQAIGLVRGGWLPSALAATRDNAVIFPDRNILTEIAGRFAGGQTVRRDPDFLDLFAGTKVKINPVIAAMEGNRRAVPTPDEMRAQLEEAVDKLKRALPQATLMVGSESLKGSVRLIEGIRPSLERQQALLKALAPSLCKPIAQSNMDAAWDAVMEAADAHQVPRSSLLILALLSALVHPRGQCAAKRLLKMHDSYSDADAYNALSDLRALELLLHALAFFPDFETHICTKDRQLALFWVGAGAHNIERDGDSISFLLTPHPAILPERYATRWAEAVHRG